MEHDTKSRKWRLTVAAMLALHAVLAFHLIPMTGTEYVAALSLILGMYKAANLGDKFLEGRNGSAP